MPIERTALYRWVTEMTCDDCESFTPDYKAMNSFLLGSRFFMVNVECIGGEGLVRFSDGCSSNYVLSPSSHG